MREPTAGREGLFKALQLLSQYYLGFPKLWETYLQTSKPEQLILLLRADGMEAAPSPVFSGTDWLRIVDLNQSLALFPDEDGYVNSTKVLESLTIYLSGLSGYQAAQLELETTTIHLTLEAEAMAEFSLRVAVPVHNQDDALLYYLFPNGLGNWKRVVPEAVAQL
ncbi:MAG: hypothetical protein AAFN08_07770 [Cyanobacteria bacterium J06559_3]